MAIDKPTSEIVELLREGIAAAKERRPAEAQALLQRVIARDPDNVQAWLWMSGVVAHPLKREACLRKVLSLDPDHGAARRGLMVAQRRAAAAIFPQAVAAAEAGDAAQARKLLTDVVVRDETNADAWMWLSRVVDTAEDQEICFQNILMLDPHDAEARKGLAVLQQASAMVNGSPWNTAGQIADDDTPVAPTLAGAILGDPYREKHTTLVPEPEPEPEPLSATLWKRYEDPHLCPACASPTDPEDRHCPTCHSKLWIKSREREHRSQLLWIMILLQAGNTVAAMTAPFLALFVVSLRLGLNNTKQLLNAYLGVASDLSATTLTTAMAMLSRTEFFLLGIPFVVGVAVTIALYLRWRPVFYMLLVSSVLGLAGSIGGIAFLGQNPLALIGGTVGIALSVATVVLAIKLEDDFRIKRQRILFASDRGLKSGMDYLLKGRAYASHGVWALAALHFRRAAMMMPNQVDGLLGVAQAGGHLHDLELARWALRTAQEHRPDDHRIEAALAQLEAKSGPVSD